MNQSALDFSELEFTLQHLTQGNRAAQNFTTQNGKNKRTMIKFGEIFLRENLALYSTLAHGTADYKTVLQVGHFKKISGQSQV